MLTRRGVRGTPGIPVVFAIGLAIAAAAVAWGRPTFAAWRRLRPRTDDPLRRSIHR